VGGKMAEHIPNWKALNTSGPRETIKREMGANNMDRAHASPSKTPSSPETTMTRRLSKSPAKSPHSPKFLGMHLSLFDKKILCLLLMKNKFLVIYLFIFLLKAFNYANYLHRTPSASASSYNKAISGAI
jgi:hypothetical protein